MDIKIIYILLLMVQYGICLHVKNCTNSSTRFTSFQKRPKMKFYLFTNNNFFKEQEILVHRTSSMNKSHFSTRWPVRILVHGWGTSLLSCFNAYVKDAYLRKGNFNVFVVDWSDWAQNFEYFEVIPYINDKLGPLLAEFLDFLRNRIKIPNDKIYLIGHSMGAHLCGSAGHNLNVNLKQVHTIFGLDPAGPGFQDESTDKRLDPNDAKYVEQIQTNMGGAGYSGVIGHAAFYPNYGRIQPYCIRYYRISNPNCSHNAAYLYFAESVTTSTGFCSQPCNFNMALFLGFGCVPLTCPDGIRILMGGDPAIPKMGTYYLITNEVRDFAICYCPNYDDEVVLI